MTKRAVHLEAKARLSRQRSQNQREIHRLEKSVADAQAALTRLEGRLRLARRNQGILQTV